MALPSLITTSKEIMPESGKYTSSLHCPTRTIRALSKMDRCESWMEKLKVALRKRIQQLVADWPEIIGMHGNSSARSVWAFLRGLKSGVREPPPHGKPFHLAVASTLSETPHIGSVCSGRFHRPVMLPA